MCGLVYNQNQYRCNPAINNNDAIPPVIRNTLLSRSPSFYSRLPYGTGGSNNSSISNNNNASNISAGAGAGAGDFNLSNNPIPYYSNIIRRSRRDPPNITKKENPYPVMMNE